MSKPLYLIDASIYIFQAYFSPHMEVWDEEGRDLSAFLGYAQFLQRFLRQTRPQHIAVAFDESLFCGFRHQLYPDYKSNRVLPDEDLERQLIACAQLTEAMGIQGFGSKVYEADDIIGTLAARYRQQCEDQTLEGRSVCIVSRDKDLAQLLRHERDHVWDFSGSLRRFHDDIVRQYGIRPNQFPDYLGLVGDAVDCIPGVPGIGPVAACALLQHFQTLPQLFENLDEVASLSYRGAKKGAELLKRHQEIALLSRQLATIVEDVAHPEEAFSNTFYADLTWQAPQCERVEEVLKSLKLDSLLTQRYLALLDTLTPMTQPVGGAV
jgi:DNA polymerase-1